MAELESRIERLERRNDELSKSISAISGDVKLILFRVDELVKKQPEVANKEKECNEKFVTKAELPRIIVDEINNQKSKRGKFVMGLLMAFSALIGSVVGVLSEMAKYFK